MKIAQLAPLAEAVPPKCYGGTERIVAYLVEELVALGHEVTLFASGNSQTSAELVPIVPNALRLDRATRDPLAPLVVLVQEASRWADAFDVLHVHIDHLHLPLFQHMQLPFITTQHGRLDCPQLISLLRTFPDAPFVSISDAQRRPALFANWIGTVHHGIPPNLLHLNARPEGYLAFLGRIAPEKRLDRAIHIARRAGMQLQVAAKIDPADEAYYRNAVRPLLDQPHVEFLEEISDREKNSFLGNAAALLFPIDWPEPFGLAMIEAMACGTPVIAFNRGSVPEIIDDGVTGFVVEDESGAVAAIRRLGQLDRRRVRECFERRFTSRRMAEEYLALYHRIAVPVRML